MQSLLTGDDVELFSVVERQGAGIAFPPVDARRRIVCDGKHVRTDIDADDVSGVAEPFTCNACQYSCSASDVEDPLAPAQPHFVESHFGPWPEQRSYEPPLVHLRETCLVHRVAWQVHHHLL